MFNGDFHISNSVIERSQDELLLHEHDFISIAIKRLSSPLIINRTTTASSVCIGYIKKLE
jgi:hypothetical protein